MKKTYFTLLLLLSIVSYMQAQESMDVQTIPDSLKANAYSVIRLNSTNFIYHNATVAEQQNVYAITIMNEKGNSASHFTCYCDQFRELKNFSGELYDANGRLIRKIKSGELRFTEYFSGLASDEKNYYYECNAPTYPFTVKYKWEIKYRKGIISFPVFIPQERYNQSTEKAVYSLTLPLNTEFKYKTFNLNDSVALKENHDNITKYSWDIRNIPALEKEPFSPDMQKLFPAIYAAPTSFSYDNTKGNLTNWKTFGDWQYKLLENRDILPQNIKDQFIELVKDATSNREKIKTVYDYLAKNTRYVSIQLGIGGLQPIAASDVCATGFGDCKGLTNYMSAILKALNIYSCYTVISTQHKDLMKDFASANQMNHVILQVPLPEDTLWLECTNMELPFGYVHSNIAGHEALLIKETGSKISKLPTYPSSLNMENNTIIATLFEDGNMSAKVTNESHLFQYEDKIAFMKLSPTEQINYLRANVKLPQAQIQDIRIKENKTCHPSICIDYQINSEQYGSKTGNRIFLPINVLRKGFNKLNKNRKNDLFIKYGYKDSDNITLSIPKNYIIEALPNPVSIKGDFGTYTSFIIANDTTITIMQSLQINSGEYDISHYTDFVRFCNEVDNGYNGKIVLKKKE